MWPEVYSLPANDQVRALLLRDWAVNQAEKVVSPCRLYETQRKDEPFHPDHRRVPIGSMMASLLAPITCW